MFSGSDLYLSVRLRLCFDQRRSVQTDERSLYCVLVYVLKVKKKLKIFKTPFSNYVVTDLRNIHIPDIDQTISIIQLKFVLLRLFLDIRQDKKE